MAPPSTALMQFDYRESPKTAYVYSATLEQITCLEETASARNIVDHLKSEDIQQNIESIRRACKIVERPSIYSRTNLEWGLNLIEQAIKPWPALSVLDWFWDTAPGRLIALAQWSIYGDEALYPTAIARIFWGADIVTDKRKANQALRRVNFLMQPNAWGFCRLKSYHRPNFEAAKLSKRTGKVPWRAVYSRRIDVMALLESGDYEGDVMKRKRVERLAKWMDRHPDKDLKYGHPDIPNYSGLPVAAPLDDTLVSDQSDSNESGS